MVDYLLKPITFERFFKSVDRFLRERHAMVYDGSLKGFREKAVDDFVVVKSGNKYCKILLDDILYLESLKDYIKIHTADGKFIVSKYKIGDFELDLEGRQFLRVHRSFLINRDKITAFTSNDIELAVVQIPIGSSHKEKVIAFLDTIKGIQ